MPTCGDSNLDLGEECDDGNLIDGDGCSAGCLVEYECNVDADCADDFYGDKYCVSGDLFKDLNDYSCVLHECILKGTPEFWKDCGEDSSGEWEKYCKGDDVWKERSVYKQGCGEDDCFENVDVEKELFEECDYDCVDGECVDEPACGDSNLDLGEECDDGNLIDGDGCSANCLIEYECNVDADCGDDFYGSGYCKLDDLFRKLNSYSCVSHECVADAVPEFWKDCTPCGEVTGDGSQVTGCNGGCSEWEYECREDDVWKTRECYEKGCAPAGEVVGGGGSVVEEATCYSEFDLDERSVKKCDYGCVDGVCNECPTCDFCDFDFECGDFGIGNISDYLSGRYPNWSGGLLERYPNWSGV
ncbi:MAG: hypothetical protein KJ592_00600 [Nanoarchaeota archaeon]|nr:hypothetical protein [Nanoarchaeota archaeon]